MKAILLLEDGKFFMGESFGAFGETTGEVVFNTAMTGYQEILTDPSYNGQIVTMTYPQIGNYGINDEDIESRSIFVEGFIVKEGSPIVSNWRAKKSLDEYLKEKGIVGIQRIDTRELTRHIRNYGAKKGIISTGDFSIDSLTHKLSNAPDIVGKDLVREVTTDTPLYWFQNSIRREFEESQLELGFNVNNHYRVAVYDLGVKYNILRELEKHGCFLRLFPASTPYDKILEWKPDGIFLSNGPGDPEALEYIIANVKQLLGKLPIFGICLGHQIIGLALGGKTFKLKFGHHGANHPVKNLLTGKIEITSQNHGFAVDPDSLDKNNIKITHINLNDYTVEGFEHKHLPLFSVQYHPEASPGPHDSKYLFNKFIALMKNRG
ncbi:carbamoyl phosphate synthase small subunit [candidate division KSB1 bacterium]|nr:MAG: carbamoyl phosphate synthase small subunit [candidate division KSB1 bacterium]